MTLEFVDIRRGAADRHSWMPPFDSSVTYEKDHWWDPVLLGYDDPWYVQVLENGVEVARVELEEDVDIDHYADVPKIGFERLGIQFIEVATGKRRLGIGTRVVRGLLRRHPDRWLLAYSEGADEFWASLGWARFDHPDGDRQPLFIQPAR